MFTSKMRAEKVARKVLDMPRLGDVLRPYPKTNRIGVGVDSE